MTDYNEQFYNHLIRKKLSKSFLTVGWGSKTQKSDLKIFINILIRIIFQF